MALPKIDVPIYETKLISTGKTVKFRPFLVKEQKLFLMASESGEIKESIDIIKQILNNCLLSKVDVDDLPTFDLEHLFIQLRARSVSEVVNLRYNCNNTVEDKDGKTKTCNGVVKFDLNILELQPKIDEEHLNKIVITDKLGLVMKYPTFQMVNEVNVKNLNDLDGIMELIIKCIDYIYDENQIYYSKDATSEELMEFVDSMQQNDLEKIQKFFNTMPKFEKKLEFKCAKCKYEEDIVLEGIQNFFV
jgi:hypothetical protein